MGVETTRPAGRPAQDGGTGWPAATRTMADGERARYWPHPALPGVDLLRARYVRHRFTRHAHPSYAIGLVESGVEEFQHRGSTLRAGASGLVMVNPEVVHTGHAGAPEGWTYRMLYPSVPVVTAVAAELGLPAGTPSFPAPIVTDEAAAELLVAAHRAGEAGDPLASDTLTRQLLAALLRRHGTARRPAGRAPAAGGTAARVARDLLRDRLTDPPTLDELAAAVGSAPFPLLRAFRRDFGLPPHAWLNQHRVLKAQALLDDGVPPAECAAVVGFADQAHLSRHFRRIFGVPPGAYQRERRNVQEPRPAAGLVLPGGRSNP